MRTLAHVLALAVVFVAACASTNPRASIDQSIAAYDKKDYKQSLTLALDAQQHATNTKDADESAYMAGMSAYELADYATADRWLSEAARSSDNWIAGEAGVMLGNTKLQLKQPSAAARAFATAAGRLQGEDAKKARIAAGNAYREAGNQRSADEQFRMADVQTTVVVDPPKTTPPATKLGAGSPNSNQASAAPTGAFVLQAGAYRDESKARKRADELRDRATKAGFGAPRVVAKKANDGSTLWVVQIGGFADRRTADTALGKLGASGVVVGRAVATG